MIELILLFFMCRHTGRLAAAKGLSPLTWRIFTVIAFFLFEIIGLGLAMAQKNITPPKTLQEAQQVAVDHPGLSFFAMFVGAGGYLLIRAWLERKTPIKNK
jgi:hypothetical protein